MNDLNKNIDHDLLMAYLSGNADDKQIRDVEDWLAQNKDNERYLNQLENVWIEAGKIEPAPIFVDTDKAWDKLFENMATHDKQNFNIQPEINRKRRNINYYISAAAVIILISVFYFILNNFNTDQVEFASSEEVIEKELPDGSMISLNRNSTIRFAENTELNIRECILEGEAFFDVKHDKEKPFVIHTGETNIKVLGTSFNVNSETDEISVSVTTGKVMFYTIDEVNKDTLSVILIHGEKGIYNTDLKTFRKITPPEDEMFWLNKTLIFKETQMSKVVQILNTAYNVEINLNEEIENCIYSGTFKNESIDMVLTILSESFNLTISKEKEVYNLYGKGC